MEKVTMRNTISILSLVLGTLTFTCLSTQKTEAAWNVATCKLKCGKTVLANRSSKDFQKNVNDCAANCDNTKIKDALLAFCKNLNPTNKANLQKILEDEKMGYETAIKDNQENITRFEKATDSRGKKYLNDYQKKSKTLTDKADLVAKQMKNCEMTPTSRSVVPTSNLVPAGIDPTKLSDKEKQLLNVLTTKEKERLGLSNAVEASSDSKSLSPAGKDGGFVRAAPGHSSTALGSDASTPKLGQHRTPNNPPNTALNESIPASSSTEHSTDPVSPVEETRAPNPLLDQIQAKKLRTTQLPAKSMTNNAPSTASDIPAAPPPPASDKNSATSQPLTQPTPRGNLLAQIQGGKVLKKVDNTVPHPDSKETHQGDNSNTVQSVLSKALSQRRGAIIGKIESKETPKTDDDDWK